MRKFGPQMLVVALAAGLLAAPASADVKAGVDAWAAGNFPAAIAEWRSLADRGDADAQFNMGQAYMLGRGVPSDLKIAQSWYEKAAAQGHGEAQANLGLILFQSGNRAGAMPWIRKAADRDDPRAQYVLGTALFNGDIIGKDWPRAYALMTRAAAQGLPPAASSLTQMDEFIPLPDRQKGIAMARQIESGASRIASAPVRVAPAAAAAMAAPKAMAPAAKPGRVAGASIAAPKPAAPATRPLATAAAAPAAKPVAGGGWRVQLGAYGSPAAARGQWTMLSKKIGGLSAFQPSYEPAGAFTRLRVGPLGNRAAADKLCASAKAAGQACFPVAP